MFSTKFIEYIKAEILEWSLPQTELHYADSQKYIQNPLYESHTAEKRAVLDLFCAPLRRCGSGAGAAVLLLQHVFGVELQKYNAGVCEETQPSYM